MKILVIVESPSKCKKISNILNANDPINIFEVVATMGHIYELKTIDDININDNYKCNYSIISSKRKTIETIKNKIKTHDDIILACDNDREGSMICLNICNEFKLDVLTTKRIYFNEITESAINYAINNPTTINLNMVKSQQTRQIIDLLIGYKLSPLLWKHFPKSHEQTIAVGRCQSPALKIIYDNYCTINEFDEKQSYNTIGYFTNKNIPFKLNTHFDNKQQIIDFLSNEIDHTHIIYYNTPILSYKSPPKPLNTCRLLQQSSNEFGLSPTETMEICQKLYENGYITYIRTDSLWYSKEFINTIVQHITTTYNTKTNCYLHKNINSLTDDSTKIKTNIQGGHEAIRPTNINLLPANTNNILNTKEKKIYKLIWETTVKSCMCDATQYSFKTTISSSFNTAVYEHNSEMISFMGWMILNKKRILFDEENNIIDDNDDKYYSYLQNIKQNSIVSIKSIHSNMTIKYSSSLHFTEAKLIQHLERYGIARPSTFSKIVNILKERKYIKNTNIPGKEVQCLNYTLQDGNILENETTQIFGQEKNKLVIQPIGIQIMEFLNTHCNDIINYSFTKEMECELNDISHGELLLVNTCNKCNVLINTIINNTNNTTTNTNNNTTTNNNNNNNTNTTNNTNNCENLNNSIKGQYNGYNVILKKGKYGLYAMLEGCDDKPRSMKELGNRPIENITIEEIINVIENNKVINNNIIRKITNNIEIRKSKTGEYIYYKTNKMKKPKFFSLSGFNENYKLCELEQIQLWIKTMYYIQ
jgi:DNA topoisomerase I